MHAVDHDIVGKPVVCVSETVNRDTCRIVPAARLSRASSRALIPCSRRSSKASVHVDDWPVTVVTHCSPELGVESINVDLARFIVPEAIRSSWIPASAATFRGGRSSRQPTNQDPGSSPAQLPHRPLASGRERAPHPIRCARLRSQRRTDVRAKEWVSGEAGEAQWPSDNRSPYDEVPAHEEATPLYAP